jgi:hypothetical protein
MISSSTIENNEVLYILYANSEGATYDYMAKNCSQRLIEEARLLYQRMSSISRINNKKNKIIAEKGEGVFYFYSTSDNFFILVLASNSSSEKFSYGFLGELIRHRDYIKLNERNYQLEEANSLSSQQDLLGDTTIRIRKKMELAINNYKNGIPIFYDWNNFMLNHKEEIIVRNSLNVEEDHHKKSFITNQTEEERTVTDLKESLIIRKYKNGEFEPAIIVTDIQNSTLAQINRRNKRSIITVIIITVVIICVGLGVTVPFL